MQLSDNERKVFTALELDADQSLKEVQKATGLRDHTIRYCLKRLKDKGIIRYYPFVNVYPLGFVAYALYFSLSSDGEKCKGALLKDLKKASEVSWIGEVGGQYQYCACILGRNILEVRNFIDKLSKSYGSIFSNKSLSTQTSLTLWYAKYLMTAEPKVSSVSWGPAEKLIEIDETDKGILDALLHRQYSSRKQLASQLGIPNSTLIWRIDSLQKKGIIQGFVYLINVYKIGLQTFKMLVEIRGNNREVYKKIFQFCKVEKNITTLIECMGSWDYEMGIDIESTAGVTAVSERLRKKLGDCIGQIEIIPLFNELKCSCYPFLSGQGVSWEDKPEAAGWS